MSIIRKFNAKTVQAIIVMGCLLVFSLQIKAYNGISSLFFKSLTSLADTVPPKKPALQKIISIDSAKKKNAITDTLKKKNDSTINKTDTLSLSKDSLDAPVQYKAQDSGVLILSTKRFILYGKADATYKDMNLTGGKIDYDQDGQTIKAFASPDSTGSTDSKAVMKQGQMKSISDSLAFNLKSFKGLTHNTYYQEGEMYVNAQKLKKVDSTTFYAYNARITTCNLDTPHFAFITRRVKMINNKLAVSGPTHPEFEGVPVPIVLPFGIYPLQRGRHSGILTPTFTTSEDFGLGFEGLGYYKVISENWDVITRANIYSYGGWLLTISPKYIKRYHYSGSLGLTFQNTKILNRTYTSKDEFTTSKSFMLTWSHMQDTRARPGTSFSASVNFGSTKFNQTLFNNPYQNYNNQLNSSISYTKDFRGKANLSLSITHNQNNNTHLVNLNLPNLAFNLNTFYPFQKKERVGAAKWYENLGIGYQGATQNLISFYDTSFTMKRLLDTIHWGATHTIPISLSLPPLGPFVISPSISYAENWHGQKLILSWDSAKQKVDSNITKGFFRENQMSFGISASTRIFGTYKFKNSNIIAIRHEMRPQLSFSYHPDLVSKYFYTTQIDTAKHYVRFSQFNGLQYPSYFAEGNSGSIGFGIDNFLEMKMKTKKDTSANATKDSANATKKIKLIEGFGFSSSYNLLADSFALAPFQFYLRTTLFDKININAGATLNPYKVDSFGLLKNELMFKDGKLGRITTGNVAISTTFRSKSKDARADKERLPVDPFMTPDEQQRQLQYARSNPAEFTDFNIPWSLSVQYALYFTRQIKPDYSGFYTQITSSANFNGDFSVTPKWKAGASGYYDVNLGKLNQLTMFFTREMHCWQLAVNVTPIGLWRSFSITINPKSGILRDLKINRSRTFSNSTY
jgi:hypothetical protein